MYILDILTGFEQAKYKSFMFLLLNVFELQKFYTKKMFFTKKNILRPVYICKLHRNLRKWQKNAYFE